MMRTANGMDEFYSQMKAGGEIELFVDRNGNPTIDYPHVHIIHKNNGDMDVIASKSRGNHAWNTTVNDSRQLDSAISQAQGYL